MLLGVLSFVKSRFLRVFSSFALAQEEADRSVASIAFLRSRSFFSHLTIRPHRFSPYSVAPFFHEVFFCFSNFSGCSLLEMKFAAHSVGDQWTRPPKPPEPAAFFIFSVSYPRMRALVEFFFSRVPCCFVSTFPCRWQLRAC